MGAIASSARRHMDASEKLAPMGRSYGVTSGSREGLSGNTLR
jgi:hypothetical protein